MPHDPVVVPAEDAPSALLAYREKKKLTQQQVADMLGVSRSLVGHLELGSKPLSLRMVLLIEDRLGISRSKLLPKRKRNADEAAPVQA